MALLSWIMDVKGDATAYRKSASALKQRFNRDWWVEEEQFLPWRSIRTNVRYEP